MFLDQSKEVQTQDAFPRQQIYQNFPMIKQTLKSSMLSSKPVTLENFSQTEEAGLITYACSLFLQELHDIIMEEVEQEQEMKFQELLQKAQHIIIRIKNKANPSNGLIGGGGLVNAFDVGPSIVSQNPTMPVKAGMRTSPDRSWHFDMGKKSSPRTNIHKKLVHQRRYNKKSKRHTHSQHNGKLRNSMDKISPNSSIDKISKSGSATRGIGMNGSQDAFSNGVQANDQAFSARSKERELDELTRKLSNRQSIGMVNQSTRLGTAGVLSQAMQSNTSGWLPQQPNLINHATAKQRPPQTSHVQQRQ